MANIALKKKPVTGMKDILPSEMEIRQYVMQIIRDTYQSYGFTQIETPCVEHIENLSSKDGGENEKLIFKIMKRGEKLNLDTAETEADLVDGGLRYDLTVPLVRFYSAHENELPSPFKAIQMGNVWRADRPQRGRYRQFMQCDIDILGDSSNMAEKELIAATTRALGRIGFKGFEVRINDRRFLKAMVEYSGLEAENYDEVFIILDKMDKIGTDGVLAELKDCGCSDKTAEAYMKLYRDFFDCEDNLEAYKKLSDKLVEAGSLEREVCESLLEIITDVESIKTADFKLVYDPTLVRGMSYYTGTIFEVAMPEFGGSCGGGGRYDGMVGKFTGKDVPACGFSIGFERIVMLLLESGFSIPEAAGKLAFLVEKGVSSEKMREILSEAEKLRMEGKRVLLTRMNKNKKFQKDNLAKQGYTDIKEFFAG